MEKICNKDDCTGCFACYNICPKKAVEMKEDEYGRIYPIINKEKCIDCGLCKKTCPQINSVSFHEPGRCYKRSQLFKWNQLLCQSENGKA